MNNPFKKFYLQYLSFSKNDRNAILILSALILLLFIAGQVVKLIPSGSKYNYAQYEKLIKELEAPKTQILQNHKLLFPFDPNTADFGMLDSLDLPEYVKKNIVNYRNAGGRFSSPLDVRKIYGMNDSIFEAIKDFISISGKTFTLESQSKKEIQFDGFVDPNSAEFNQLIEFGLSPFQANNIVEYRNKGGIFKSQSDLLKIYGIDSAFFKLIESHLQIEVIEESAIERRNYDLVHVELNSADSTDLMKLYGIGSVYANRILKYRNLLGGFYSVSQLLEVYNFSEETFKTIQNNISADTLLLKKIRVNYAEYIDLLRHPYLNKKQVEAVLNYRDNNGAIKDILQLKSNGIIDSETFLRISPYLTCR